jgi:RHS repeat-associated protein
MTCFRGFFAALLLALCAPAAAQTLPALLDPPPASVCVAPTVPTEPSNVHMFPGRWWNPQRNGIGWDFFYGDGQQQMYLTWFTFDKDGRPVWLHGEAQDLVFNGVTGERTWKSRLYLTQWKPNAYRELHPVGAVSVTFPNQTTTRAAVRWSWSRSIADTYGIEAVGPLAYDECLYDTFRDLRPPRAVLNQAYSSNWFYRAETQHKLNGWGVDLLIDVRPSDQHYLETAAAAIFDEDGRPVWLQSEDDWGTIPPPADTLGRNDTGLLRYLRFHVAEGENGTKQHPAVTVCGETGQRSGACGPWVAYNEHGGDVSNKFRRQIAAAASGQMTLMASVPTSATGGAAVNWPSPGQVSPPLPATVPVMRFDADHVVVDKSVCQVAHEGDSCEFQVAWTTNDAGATLRRIDLNNFGVPQQIDAGLSDIHRDTLQSGARVQYELRYRYLGIGAWLTHRTPEVRVVVANSIADAIVQDIACQPDGENGCDLEPHDPSVGSAGGSASSDGGAALYNIPIVVPPGRNGMQPELALNYNSRSGGGLAGQGWSLSGLSAIHRCPRTLAEDGPGAAAAVTLGAGDALCLDGERLVRTDYSGAPSASAAYGVSGAYYRTEIDSFARVTQYGGDLAAAATCFKVEHKSGEISYYGGQPNGTSCTAGPSRQIPSGAVAPLSWQLQKTVDAQGNSIDYSYQSFGAGELLPAAIHYTGDSQSQGNRHVYFDYDPRPQADWSRSYMAGAMTERTQLLSGIRTTVGSAPVTRYALDYRDAVTEAAGSLHNGRALLQKVTRCASGGDEAPAEVCFRPTQIAWNDLPVTHVLRPLQVAGLPGPQPLSGGGSLDREAQPVGDFDGDGVRELLVRQAEGGASLVHWLVKQNADRTVLGKLDISALVAQLPYYTEGMQADFDGDGRGDLLGGSFGGYLNLQRWTRARGAAFAATAAENFSALALNVPAGDQLLSTDDIDHDGYADLLIRRRDNCTQPASAASGSGPYTQRICYYRNTTTSPQNVSFAAGVEIYTWTHPEIGGGISSPGDFNGDGQRDFLVQETLTQPQGAVRAVVRLLYSVMPGISLARFCNRPSGKPYHDCPPGAVGLPTTDTGYRSFQAVPRWMDINGDGLVDLLFALPGACQDQGDTCARGSWQVQISSGVEFRAAVPVVGNTDALLMTTGMDKNRLRYAAALPAADVDSDGKTDLLFPAALAARHCAAVQVSFQVNPNDGNCDYEYDPAPGEPDRGGGGEQCSARVWMCGSDPGTTPGQPAFQLPDVSQLPSVGAITTDDMYAARAHRASFDARDRSLYEMAALRFVTLPNGQYEAQRFTLNATAGINRAAHRVLMSLGDGTLDTVADDWYGDGLTDIATQAGCLNQGLGATHCRYLGDGVNGPASFAVNPVPNGNPVNVNVADLNNGVRTLFNENIGAGENGYSAPTLPGLVRYIRDGIGDQVNWFYYPLSSRGERSAGELPLYQIPADGYADDSHFYFQSTMPVVGTMLQRTGNGFTAGARSWRYGYAEAMYNRKGRGFQGFRAILREQMASSADASRALREVTVFHQKFPLSGKVEITRSGRANGSPSSSLGYEDWVVPFSEERQLWGCHRAAPATCNTAGTPAVASFDYPFVDTQTTTSFDPASVEQGNPQALSQVVVSNRAPLGDTGWDRYGNLTYTKTDASDLAGAAGSLPFVLHKVTRQNKAYTHLVSPAVWWPDRLDISIDYIDAVQYHNSHKPPADATPQTQQLRTAYYWNDDRTADWVAVESPDVLQSSVQSFVYPSGADNHGLPTGISVSFFDSALASNVIRTTSTLYDETTGGYFPAAVINAEGQATTFIHRARDGQLESSISPTQVKTRHFYDAFGRVFRSELRKADDPAGALLAQPVHTAWNRCEVGVCAGVGNGGRRSDGLAAEQFATYRVTTVQNGSPTRVTWHDLLGREVKTAARGYDGSFIASTTEYDAMGQVQKRSVPFFLSSATASAPFYADLRYDRAGRVIRKTAPDGEASADAAVPAGRELISTYTYAGNSTTVSIGNSRSLCNPSNLCFSVKRYNGVLGLMRTDDALQGVTRYWADAAGRPVAIADVKTNNLHPNLATQPIPAGRATVAAYNPLGQRVSAGDPNQGQWSFVYNAAGEVVRQTDARGVETVTERDALGRPLIQHSIVTSTLPNVLPEHYRDQWIYDAQTGLLQVMRRCQRENQIINECVAARPAQGAPPGQAESSWNEVYAYDGYGRLTGTTTSQPAAQIVPGQPERWEYKMEYLYDANYGREKAVIYARSGLKVQNIYTRYGALRDKLDADTGARFWGVGGADAWGNVTRQDYGNGMIGEFRYSPLTGRAQSRQWRRGNGTDTPIADRVEYSYDVLGNLSQQRRLIPGAVDSRETYSYDGLQRLVRTGQPELGNDFVAYSYDALGNLLSKSDYSAVTDAYQYNNDGGNNCGPNVALSILMRSGPGDTLNFHCDLNGNIIKRLRGTGTVGRTTAYDAGNRPRFIDDPTAPGRPHLLFHYAPDGQRVYQVQTLDTPQGGGARDKRYIVQGARGYQFEMKEGAQQPELHRHELGEVSVVLRPVGNNGATTYDVLYKANDRLGSPLGLMNRQRNFSQMDNGAETPTQLSFDAFGAGRDRNFAQREPLGAAAGRINLTPATRQGFTGHEHLDDLGLIHMNGRVYDHGLGRFLSVDPFVQFPANSQSLNPYSYIMNNPLSGTDPSGYLIRRRPHLEQGSCMGDEECDRGVLTGPAQALRDEVMAKSGSKVRWNGHDSRSVVQNYEDVVHIGKIESIEFGILISEARMSYATGDDAALNRQSESPSDDENSGLSDKEWAAEAKGTGLTGAQLKEAVYVGKWAVKKYASVCTTKECGGLIYKQGNKIKATASVMGQSGSVDPFVAMQFVPEGATVLLDYHIHDRPQEGLTAKFFSTWDVRGSNGYARRHPGFVGSVLGAEGAAYFYKAGWLPDDTNYKQIINVQLYLGKIEK